jgi:hypothetical protein
MPAAERLPSLALCGQFASHAEMDLDDLFRRYFGTSDILGLTADGQAAGVERIRVDLGLERDSGKRFALWAVLYLVGDAPDLDVAFKDEADREAARNFMDLVAAAEQHPGE